jgi:hypothetical protein
MTAVIPSVFKPDRVVAMEEAVAEYAKPMVAFIAGAAAPPRQKRIAPASRVGGQAAGSRQ